METNTKIYRHKFCFYFCIFFLMQLPAQDIDLNNSIQMNSLVNEVETNATDLHLKNPLLNLSLDLTKIVDSSSRQLTKTSFNKLANNISEITLQDAFILEPGSFIQVKGIDGKRSLFDGKLLIQFKTLPNLEDYAISKELELVNNLTDINIGIFKVKNILELELKIDSLRGDDNVIAVKLNTIDPTIKSR